MDLIIAKRYQCNGQTLASNEYSRKIRYINGIS